MSELQQTQTESLIPAQQPEMDFQQDRPTILLSDKEAIHDMANGLLRMIFEQGGFEEMLGGSGFGVALGALKPTIQRKALESVAAIDDAKADWLVRQIHFLSFRLETVTGKFSPFHYEESDAGNG